jgi:PmbA/TldA metallopeptidase C-terminal domain
MEAPPPTEADLFVLADAALAEASGAEHAQATASWEQVIGEAPRTEVDVVALDAVAGALPAPVPGRAHQGYDPGVLRLEPGGLTGGVAKVAIVSTHGVRAFEQRSCVVRGASAAPGPAALAEGPEAPETPDDAPPADAPEDGFGVVLGAVAVAQLLDRLREDFGRPGAMALGTRVAASTISLSESPRFAATLPRSYDVHGTPRQPVPLIQDGVAHRIVSLATGHAVAAGRPEARPEHLVLVGGGATSVAELLAPIADGLYLPELDRAYRILDGALVGRVDAAGLDVDPLEVLASAQALTSRQQTVPAGTASPRAIGATVCPALRAGAGVRF